MFFRKKTRQTGHVLAFSVIEKKQQTYLNRYDERNILLNILRS